MVRRGSSHADNIFDEESHGDHGPSAEADKRPQLARELEARLTGPDRTGMLRASVSLAVGAADPRGARAPRRAAAPRVRDRAEAAAPQGPAAQALRQPPARPAVPASRYYDSMLLPEEFGAMVPTATTHVGSKAGPAIARHASAPPSCPSSSTSPRRAAPRARRRCCAPARRARARRCCCST